LALYQTITAGPLAAEFFPSAGPGNLIHQWDFEIEERCNAPEKPLVICRARAATCRARFCNRLLAESARYHGPAKEYADD
jgi:hypothetical protein